VRRTARRVRACIKREARASKSEVTIQIYIVFVTFGVYVIKMSRATAAPDDAGK